MPRATRTVRVARITGEPFRYRVESWENPAEPHLVDLLDNDGNGGCSCWDFRKACTDNLTKNLGRIIRYGSVDRPNRHRTQCRHIDAAHALEDPNVYRAIARAHKAGRQAITLPV